VRTVCKVVTGIYAALCIAALLAIPLGGDALSGVFAVILAMPWLHLFNNLIGDAASDMSTRLALVGTSMGLNIAILWYGCRWLTTGKLTPD
jgi:hypothetical protein